MTQNRLQLSDNAILVLKKRYLKKDSDGKVIETPEKMFQRVSHFIAQAEKNYENTEQIDEIRLRFYELMTSFKFLPNSPTLMNAGRSLGQLAACFVLPIEDSMEGIFDALKNAAMIHKSGGGTGFSFSRLRPHKSRVGTTGGVASGPVSFMKIFNTATEQVKQGGTRRGANMAILRVDHPDIMDFIHSKKNNGDLNNFNISVGVTDAFMQAVKNRTSYNLIDPRDKRIAGKLEAADVYQALVHQAWENGDPGIIFLDRINRDNPTPALGEIESTNPCVTADTFVLTANGPRQIGAILGNPVNLVLHGQPTVSGEQGFFNNGAKNVFRLTTHEGHCLRLTADHKIRRAASVSRNRVVPEWVRADQLQPGDKLILNNHRALTAWPGQYGKAEGYLMGLLVGDGTLKADKAVISVWAPRQAVNGDAFIPHTDGVMKAAEAYAFNLPHRADFCGWQSIAERGEYRLVLSHVKQVAEHLGMSPGNKVITAAVETCSSDFYCEFLSGLFDADGSVQGAQQKGVSIRLASSEPSNLVAVQRMLLRMGINSTIYMERRPAGAKMLPDSHRQPRRYALKAQHELVISRDNLLIFEQKIGFKDDRKRARLSSLIASYRRTMNRERFLATFDRLTPDGAEPVFDVQVPTFHAFDANGFYVHNCGEQPLLPLEACNLGSINLAKFVLHRGDTAEIDYHALKDCVHLSVRFLDNTIDMSRYPLPEIDAMVRGNRKIGLGVMGFADLLYQLKIPYNSKQALKTAETVMDFVQTESHAASCALAEQRGVFPNFEQSVFNAKKDRRPRNATTTTIAPTGSLSILAGCSSGIEPLFALSFVRRVMDDDRLMEINPWFEKIAKERGFFNRDLMNQVAKNGTIAHLDNIPADVRRIFVTAHDISPQWHVQMQAAFQRHTDNAVSKTVNMPRDAGEDDVRQVYDMAWSLGCKGVTIYRDGSKEKQVLSIASETGGKKGFISAVKDRPETLEGFTTKMATGLGQLYVTVTEYDGRPFEVFATIGKSGRSTTAKTEAIGRLVSLALRAGVRAEKIVDQLKGIGGQHPVFQNGGLVLSIPDAISRVLENRYLKGKSAAGGRKSGAADLRGETCPECGQTISFEEGCMTCHFCGFTKCG